MLDVSYIFLSLRDILHLIWHYYILFSIFNQLFRCSDQSFYSLCQLNKKNLDFWHPFSFDELVIFKKKKLKLKCFKFLYFFLKEWKKSILIEWLKKIDLMALTEHSFLTFSKLINSYYRNFNFLIINNNFFASLNLQLLIENKKYQLNNHSFDDL